MWSSLRDSSNTEQVSYLELLHCMRLVTIAMVALVMARESLVDREMGETGSWCGRHMNGLTGSALNGDRGYTGALIAARLFVCVQRVSNLLAAKTGAGRSELPRMTLLSSPVLTENSQTIVSRAQLSNGHTINCGPQSS